MRKAVIEVGVNLGQDTENLILENPDCSYYGFEPTYILLPTLLEKFKNYPNATFVPLAVDLENRQAQFNIANWHNLGCSSLHEFSDNIRAEWPDNPAFFNDRQSVLTMRLDTFCDIYKIDSVEKIWIDAQGNDLNVLKSLGKYIDTVRSGQVEVAYNVNLYKGADNTFSSAVKWLTERGFDYELKFDATPQKAEVDIIFFRK